MPRQKSTPTQLHQVQPDARADTADAGAEGAPFTLRVRHPGGTERLTVRSSQTLGALRAAVGELTKVEPLSRVLLYADMGCSEPLLDDDELLGADLHLGHGDMLTMQEKPKPQRKKKADDAGVDGAGAVAKRPKAVAAKVGGEYLSEGKTPRDIAIAFMTPDARMTGEAAYSQMAASARLDAIAEGRVELQTQQKGAKTPQKNLCVQFTGNRRAFEERMPRYNHEELVGIVEEILARQTTASRRTASSASHLLNAEAIARRSPAMFWSIYALDDAGANWDERLQSVTDVASAGLAPGSAPQ
ncbi:hypothetical protein T492DRAFT_1045571 [Pavlovales sp. CCMP2436]|nr:hypothetical protein T492DRAFT_1045571 [Pavlovales sp. CCMP2436]